ncbi:MAG: histidine phosphatase family protein [Actinomycetota bacterium]|nr:histidine phosphatase family protein [Actinomycetota bacterium]
MAEPGRYEQRPFALPPDATEMVLLRHGATAAPARGVRHPMLDGRGDPPLTEIGEAQAARAAERLAAEAPAAVFVTGLQRTAQTAAPLASRLGLEPVEIPELREVFLGDWEGGEFRIRMADQDPLAIRVVVEESWELIPNAESAEGVAARTRAGIERAVELTGAGRTGVAVVHGGVIGDLCRQATGSRPFAFLHADNASISRLVVFGDGRWLLRSFNDVAHLG